MKIRHKQTKTIETISYSSWLQNYIPRKLDQNYDILEVDLVYLRLINDDGTRTYMDEMIERPEAMKIVKKDLRKYELIEQYGKIGRGSVNVSAYKDLSYQDFKQGWDDKKFAMSLDDAYFKLTGKFPPKNEKTSSDSFEEINSIREFDEPKQKPVEIFEQPTNPCRIYKLSIGPFEIDGTMFGELLSENLVTVHKSTQPLGSSKTSQFEAFSNANYGDYFYLCRGNQEVVLIGKFTDEHVFYSIKRGYDGWGLRRSDIVQKSNPNDGYEGQQKWWTPNNNSTFTEIPPKEYELANELIFNPYFGMSLNELIPSEAIHYLKDEPNNTKKTIIMEKATPFSISENVEGVIGVKELAEELSDLLIRLKSEKGMMFGIFGKWGRGKSFLWRNLKTCLNEKQESNFIFSEFHAWKYQDTPASWAYLYETITSSCINASKVYNLFGMFKIIPIVWKMNYTKHGFKSVFYFLLSFTLMTSWAFISTEFDLIYKVLGWTISGGITAAFLIILFKVYTTYIPRARDLFKQYSDLPSFKDLLGFQSEIQDELIHLLKARFRIPNLKRSSDGKMKKGRISRIRNAKRLSIRRNRRRLMLFVDDIDRCDEKRIIQIIDSLKVMLEDPEISSRVVIIAAIDERVLRRSISLKYYDLIEKDFHDEPDIKAKTLETLTREYLDKVFISGIKLTQLDQNEKIEIFNAFSKDKGKVNFRETESNEELSETIPGLFHDDIKPNNIKLGGGLKSAGVINIETSNENFEIEEFEYNNLLTALNLFKEATPRSIRIYYYRYLLAKKIMKYRIPDNTILGNKWHFLDSKNILPELIIQYSTDKMKNLDDLRISARSSETEEIKLQLISGTVEIDKELAVKLFDIVEMVVPY